MYWKRPYGWRTGDQYVERGAKASDVVRYESEVLENDNTTAPRFVLEEVDAKGYTAGDVVWVCKTRDHARYYAHEGTGQPYKVDFGVHPLIIASDNEEPEKGYLVLTDSSRLEKSVLDRYAAYGRTHRIPVYYKPPQDFPPGTLVQPTLFTEFHSIAFLPPHQPLPTSRRRVHRTG